MSKIKICIAEDHRIVRDGIKSLLEEYDDIAIIHEADNGKQLLENIANEAPDVVLMDLDMPVMNGLAATEKLRSDYPDIKVLILSMHNEPAYVIKAVECGAAGYLLKNVEKEELIQGIRTLFMGRKYFNAETSAILSEGIAERHRNEKDDVEITPREKEVLELVAEGLSTKMIADKLNISNRTVETHRVNLMKKMNASNTADLVKKALSMQLIR